MAPKICLVEDDFNMLALLQTLLQLEGFHAVQIRENKLSTIFAALKQEKPDLALIDVNLREVSGFDLLKMIRSDADLKTMRVLMSSGLDLSTECIRQGADAFLLKPFMPDDLIHLIQEKLEA